MYEHYRVHQQATLIRTNILVEDNGVSRIDLHPDDPLIENMLATIIPGGDPVDKRHASFVRLLRQGVNGHELLFDKLPKAFGYIEQFNVGLFENLAAAKKFYDECLG